MMVQKQIQVELKIFHVGPKKKIKFFKFRLNPLCNLEHFSLNTTKFDIYMFLISLTVKNLNIRFILSFLYPNCRTEHLRN